MRSASITPAELRRRIATNTRRLRVAASLTIKEVAARAEMHWRHWQKVEAGHTNATMATIVKVAAALRVDPSDLLREPPPVPGKAK
jgi:transcriptional regulator with XRE-family HTH domain